MGNNIPYSMLNSQYSMKETLNLRMLN